MRRYGVLLALVLVVSVIGCDSSTQSDLDDARDDADPPEITAFGFRASENSELSSDVTGSVVEGEIRATVPAGTDRTGLVAWYDVTEGSVSPSGEVDWTQSPSIAVEEGSRAAVYIGKVEEE